MEIDAGHLDARLYSVISENGTDEKRFWFALRMAGSPIHMEHWQHGRLIFRMTLLEYDLGEGAAPGTQPNDAPLIEA